MLLPSFNKDTLKNELSRLDSKQRLTFGAACCERLTPNYFIFQEDTGWGNSQPLQDALSTAWTAAVNQNINSKNIKQLITSCEENIPDSDDFTSLFVAAAQDACFAICSLLDYLLENDINKIVQVATYSTDSVDLYVQEIEGLAPNDPELEQKILSHDLMQRELCKQKEDIGIIEQMPELTEAFLKKLKNSCSWSQLDKPA